MVLRALFKRNGDRVLRSLELRNCRSDFESVIFLKVHKSIYRHMLLWLEKDFIPVYFEEYYGTGIGGL